MPGSEAWPGLQELLVDLPERFREPARRLAAELASDFGAPVEWEEPAERSDPGSWHDGLDTREAWAVAELFRGSIDRWAGATGRSAGEAHSALDRALLSAARASVDHLSRSNRSLLAEVAHDIRSPMHSVLFLADAIRSERAGPLNETQRRQVGVLYTASVTLVKMVNDLIDWARTRDRAEISVSDASFSVESVLADTRALLGPLATHRDVTLHVDIATEGLRSGDPQLLARVLLNLVTNAVQAVDEGGRVSIRIDDSPEKDLRVAVADDRLGTDVDHLRGLLTDGDPDPSARDGRGWTHGLGLRICARLVRAAQGRIVVTGQPASGTVFTVELPFRPL